MRVAALALGAAFAAAVAAGACRDHNTYDCYDGNATNYGFRPVGDSVTVFHWPASRMPVRVYAEPVGELPANVDSAMVLWVNAFRCGELSMVRVTDSAQADVIVRNPAALPAAPGILLGADSVGACGGVTPVEWDTSATPDSLTGPIHSYVAPKSADTVAVNDCYHFTVAHELGHALGIWRESPYVSDLMYLVPRRRVASPNDRFTIQLLYQTAPTIVPAP